MCSWPTLPSTTMAEGSFSDSDKRGIIKFHPYLFEPKKSDKARVRVVKQEPEQHNRKCRRLVSCFLIPVQGIISCCHETRRRGTPNEHFGFGVCRVTGVGTNFPYYLVSYVDDDTSKLFTQLESVDFVKHVHVRSIKLQRNLFRSHSKSRGALARVKQG